MNYLSFDKILGTWGEDLIKGVDSKIHAEDYYCVRCQVNGRMVPSVSFWPVMDPDIQDFPYCRSCIDILTLYVFGKGPDFGWE